MYRVVFFHFSPPFSYASVYLCKSHAIVTDRKRKHIWLYAMLSALLLFYLPLNLWLLREKLFNYMTVSQIWTGVEMLFLYLVPYFKRLCITK